MSEEKNITKTSVSFEALSSLDAPVSFWKGIPFGLQHVMAMFVANLAPIFLVASAAKMDAAQSATIIQAGLLVAGLGTCLQLYGLWLIGSRLPMVTGISFTYVAAARSIAQNQGYGAVAGAVVLGGLLEVVLGLTAKYWRRFVPPIVSAIVVTSIGFSLLSVGATSFGGGSGAKDFGSWQNLTLGLISLVACLAFQLLMKGTAKQLSVLFGLVVGYMVAIVMGKVDFSGFSSLQVVSVPHFMPFQLEFDPGAIISFALLYVVSSVEVLGDTAALTKVGLDRQPTDRETAGAIAGDGLISSVSGLFGCLPLTSFAQNIGLVAMTKVINRKLYCQILKLSEQIFCARSLVYLPLKRLKLTSNLTRNHFSSRQILIHGRNLAFCSLFTTTMLGNICCFFNKLTTLLRATGQDGIKLTLRNDGVCIFAQARVM